VDSVIAILLLLLGQATPLPTATPDAVATNQAQADEALSAQATAQAVTGTGFVVDPSGEQIYNNGQPLLPSVNSPDMQQAMSYTKWFVDSQSTQAIFGPFAPILNHVRIWLLLTLAWMVFWFATKVVTVTLKFSNFIINKVLDLIPG
jgi:hypothetical protein